MTTTSTNNPQKPSPRFFLWWVIANTITVTIAILGIYIFFASLGYTDADVSIVGLFATVTPPTLIIGIAQWLVIRRHIARSALWVLSTAVGAVLAPAITPIVLGGEARAVGAGPTIFLALLPAIAQLFAGILQGFLLASQFPKFSWSEWLGALVGGAILVSLVMLFITPYIFYQISPATLLCLPFLPMSGAPFAFTTGSALKKFLGIY